MDRLGPALAGLIDDPRPVRVAAAINAFNQLVEAAPVAYLAAPPPEFRAVHAILMELVAAAAAAAG
jgi:hypothetical protein